MRLFDPLFFPEPEPLEDLYDFIVCTEVIEHFHRPVQEFLRFDRMLSPGGWLALMTCFQTDDDRFAAWHYRRDPTHVVFYCETTLRYICMNCDEDIAEGRLRADPSVLTCIACARAADGG